MHTSRIFDLNTPRLPASRQGFAAILLVAIVTTTTILIGVFLKQNKKPQSVVQTTVQASPSPIDESVHPDLIETNWKKYKSQKLGIEFKYPNNYLISHEDDKKVVIGFDNGNSLVEEALTFSNDKSTFIDFESYKVCEEKIGELPNYPCIAEWKWVNEQGMSIIDPIVDSRKSKKFQFAIAQDGGYYLVQTIDDPKVEIKFIGAAGGTEIKFRQILSTFKFTN